MKDLPHATIIATRRQTAGRGQVGNSWESAPDSNVTLSLLLRPEGLSAKEQFVISEITALAVVATLSEMIEEQIGEDSAIAIKWPNDIYVGDRKICGILIENTICGTSIERSIVGVGLNVNQEKFYSDAPNPVSLHQLTGKLYDLDKVELSLCNNILTLYEQYVSASEHQELHKRYFDALWHRDGVHGYRDAASGESFYATIEEIGPMGHITLRDTDNRLRTYAFKEVVQII